MPNQKAPAATVKMANRCSAMQSAAEAAPPFDREAQDGLRPDQWNARGFEPNGHSACCGKKGHGWHVSARTELSQKSNIYIIHIIHYHLNYIPMISTISNRSPSISTWFLRGWGTTILRTWRRGKGAHGQVLVPRPSPSAFLGSAVGKKPLQGSMDWNIMRNLSGHHMVAMKYRGPAHFHLKRMNLAVMSWFIYPINQLYIYMMIYDVST